ncbi:uncharacterized protein LOC112511276 [Cynara cardunculus var. scolymus]|uniref:Uncharacterized protein n=1 Tax=Cynara cardunculus var. scolymus TaxID=59895 RepID=A0A103XWB9_CYNCS|nr:uncharacterized protein LOC112511276 [Cynara cardunculus var. scolymus]KVH98011.1 hypothetical protein Ccrd_023760 [Cynara cardunculus var. scolymus]
MASFLTPITIISCASSNHRSHRKNPAIAASASGKWWTPIFGWSSDPDYIHNPTTITDGSVTESSDPDKSYQCRSRFSPGCFTEEKAKQMRMKTVETANFHDIMYHSAIASRLASDVSGHYSG